MPGSTKCWRPARGQWGHQLLHRRSLAGLNGDRDLVHRGVPGADLTWLAGAQSIAAMLSVIAGLSCFLAEVCIATHSSHIDVLSFEG